MSPSLSTVTRGRWRYALPAVTLLAAATMVPLLQSTTAGAATATVAINASTSLGTVPAVGQGVNVAVYDGYMNDSPVAGLLSNAGVNAVRYPGGSYADIYHWQTNTADNGGYIAPNTSFDTYMSTVKSAGAQPVLIANYGSGTAAEAAAWVRYANVTKGYGAKYWEIGNEVYGNGHYGSSWENDTHADKSPTAYANNFLSYVSAMKAVDSTIKIGVVLTTPGGWPDAVVGSGDSADWNHTVMSIVKDKADFAIIHYYPGATSESNSLSKPATDIPTMTSTIRSIINQYAGTNAANMGIAVTETNPGYELNSATAALFAPDSYLTWWENGVFNIDWWNLHNGAGSTTTNGDGTTNYGDEGILSNASSGEPAAETPFPPYYGISMLKQLGAAGSTLVKATSSNTLVGAHAVKTSDGGLNVLLVNRDLSSSSTVALSYTGYTPATGPTTSVWKKGDTAISSSTSSSATSVTLPAYSLTTLHLKPSSGGTTSAPATTTPAATTPAATTPASTTPASTTPAVTTPATTTPGSGSATCSVVYHVGSSWSTGFVADVTINNKGTSAINGWTLGFSFAGNQQITNAWNGVATQSGTAVTVKNASYNSAIAAGGNTAFGFQASYSGTNTNPTAFTVNGTACTTG